MDERAFIISRLEQWSAQFPAYHFTYAYERSTEFHIIVVEQIEALRTNKALRKEVRIFHKEFDELFPNVDMMVSKPSDSYDMNNVVYDNSIAQLVVKEVCVSSVSRTTSCLDFDSFPISYDLWSSNEVDSKFTNKEVNKSVTSIYALAA